MLKLLAKRVLERAGLRHDFLDDARKILGDASGLVLFDVGANIGQTADDMLRRFNAPRIYSFEPSPASFATLSSRFRSVTLENIAFGDTCGAMPFHTSDEWSVNDSLLKPTHETKGSTIQVKVDTVDAYCQRNGIERIDLLKIDTQGYDVKVIEGAAGMLTRCAIRLFSAESNLTPMYEGQPATSALFAIAERLGYRTVGVYPGDYWGDRLAYLNVLFESPH